MCVSLLWFELYPLASGMTPQHKEPYSSLQLLWDMEYISPSLVGVWQMGKILTCIIYSIWNLKFDLKRYLGFSFHRCSLTYWALWLHSILSEISSISTLLIFDSIVKGNESAIHSLSFHWHKLNVEKQDWFSWTIANLILSTKFHQFNCYFWQQNKWGLNRNCFICGSIS